MTTFKPIPNPYIVGNPIKNRKMFYGREDDFEFLRNKLGSENNSHIIILCGERRSGKTSILFQLLNGELGPDYLPVLVDMQTMAASRSDAEFFEKFAIETLKNMPQGLLDPSNYDFNTNRVSPYKVFDTLLDDIHISLPYQKVIFLIDEFELIDAKIEDGSLNQNFVHFLSGVLESDRRISFILTGSLKLEERNPHYWSILFGKALYRNMSFLSQGDTYRLMTEPIESRVSYDENVLDRIFQLTAGQPFYSQVVCQNIIDHLNERKRNHVDLALLETIIDELLENPLPQMLYFWNNLNDQKRLLLSFLSELLKNGNDSITAATIFRAARKKEYGISTDILSINTNLEALYHAQVLSKKDDRYRFQMDLFRRWIKREHSIWRELKEVGNVLRESGGKASGTTQEIFGAGQGWQQRLFGSIHLALKRFEWPSLGGLQQSLATIQWPQQLPFSTPALRWSGISLAALLVIASGILLIPDGMPAEQPASLPLAGEIHTVAVVQETPYKTATALDSLNDWVIVLPDDANSDTVYAEVDPPADSTIVSDPDPPVKAPAKKKTSRRKTYSSAKRNRARAIAAMNHMKIVRRDARKFAENLYAKSYYHKAREKDISAFRYYNRRYYKKSAGLFKEAEKLYLTAIREAGKSDKSLLSEAQYLQNSIEQLNPELNYDHRDLEEYRRAMDAENEANVFLANGDHAAAVKNYKAAVNLYQSAMQRHQQRVDEVKHIIREYARALEQEDLGRLAKLYVDFSPDNSKRWSNFFRTVSELKVEIVFDEITFTEEKASSRISIHFSYSGAGGSGYWHQWEPHLTETDTGWLITRINHQNQR